MTLLHLSASVSAVAAHAYRADQVGSLLRPAPLLDARAAFDRGELSRETLRQVEDRAIDTALDLQREVGLDVYSDGESESIIGRWLTLVTAASWRMAATRY